jgi:hypothetical protein
VVKCFCFRWPLVTGRWPLAAPYHKTLKNGEQMFEHLFAVFFHPMLPFHRGKEDAYRKLNRQTKKYRTIRRHVTPSPV